MTTKHILDGYKVLDLTHVLAGPSATRLLAEMGAEVIKIEVPPAGDVGRRLPYLKNGRSVYYVQQNRGKKSLCLDVKCEQGRQIVHELVKKVDIVIENFAPGVVARLGVGWEQVHAINPGVIMCSISAFGQHGPMAALPGFDYIAQAYSGVTGMIGERDGPPYFPMLGLGDVNTGAHAAAAIGYALLHREKTGEGQYLDISLLDTYFHAHEINVQMCSATGGAEEPTRSGTHHYAVTPLGLFKGEKHYIFVIALESQWPALCEVMGRMDLVEDPRYATNGDRVAHADDVNGIIQGWFDSLPSDKEILRRLEGHRIPCAPVLSISETMAQPHLAERGTIRTVSDPVVGDVQLPGMPLRFSLFPHNIPLQAAYLGQHNEAVLSETLGYSADRIAQLRGAGVIFSDPAT